MRTLRVATAVLALALLGAAGDEVELPLPAGVLPPEVPADNPLTRAKVELGKKLYFDARLSKNGNQACASCHAPTAGFADPRGTKTSAGSDGRLGPRNTPSSMNAAFSSVQF
jgi:cytochrome c peroxidase